MTHRYGHPILVTCAEDGSPTLLRWRSVKHHVRAVLAQWDLRDRWWEPDAPAGVTGAASERRYYRLNCEDGLLCDVYYDAAIGHWVLELVHD